MQEVWHLSNIVVFVDEVQERVGDTKLDFLSHHLIPLDFRVVADNIHQSVHAGKVGLNTLNHHREDLILDPSIFGVRFVSQSGIEFKVLLGVHLRHLVSFFFKDIGSEQLFDEFLLHGALLTVNLLLVVPNHLESLGRVKLTDINLVEKLFFYGFTFLALFEVAKDQESSTLLLITQLILADGFHEEFIQVLSTLSTDRSEVLNNLVVQSKLFRFQNLLDDLNNNGNFTAIFSCNLDKLYLHNRCLEFIGSLRVLKLFSKQLEYILLIT